MLDGVQGISFSYVLCGIIWAVALGLAVGNYACSLVHRLPRGKLLLDKPPYCGSCGTLLKTKDLFPVISAVLLRHRCRYCNAPFPTSHTWTEILVALLFVLAFLQHGFSEPFYLIVFIGVFLITLAAIHANEGIIMGKVLLCVVVAGMLYRTLQDGSIYGFFAGGLFGLILGTVIKYKDVRRVGHIYSLPQLAQLLAVGGICVGAHAFPAFLVLFGVFYIAGKLAGKIPLTVPFGFAIMLPVLYPALGLFYGH